MKLISIVLALTLFSSCVSQADYNRVQNENNSLKAEIEDVKYGAGRLLKQAKEFYANKQYDQAAEKINLLIGKHNEAPEAQEARTLQGLIIKAKADLEELTTWNGISDGDTSAIANYVTHYPAGKYVSQAHTRYRKAIEDIEVQAYANAIRQNSAYTWRSFLEAYPNRSDVAEIQKKIVQAEIAEIRGSDNVSSLPSSYQTDYGYSDNSSVAITNNTGYTLTVRYSGPTVTSISIPAGGTQTAYLRSGSYQVGATAGSTSCAGTENLHGSYTCSYVIRTSTSYQSYYR